MVLGLTSFLSYSTYGNSLGLLNLDNDNDNDSEEVNHHSASMDIHRWREKLRIRRKIIGLSPNLLGGEEKSVPAYNDLVDNLMESPQIERSLLQMEERNLLAGQLDKEPWSDTYWPLYKGVLGQRYAEPPFALANTWSDAHEYILANPAFPIWKSEDPKAIDKLSPSEKYDLLLSGDKTYLTDQSWQEGAKYANSNEEGEVATWMGICHGWAPASYLVPRPQKKVTVMSFDGKTLLHFYPADIKALNSLIWAKVNTPTRFVGGRCNDENPKVDENGRIIQQNCFDTNPGTWHMSVVNKIGVEKNSFIMDANYDYEVWNQPVLSYSYTYFNVETKKAGSKLEDQIIPLQEFKSDRYKKYRSSNTKLIVGITMKVTYLQETIPRQTETDDSSMDSKTTRTFVYDLELDDQRKIIGGEWYQNTHPDFLWTPAKGAKPLTMEDYSLLGEGKWDGKTPLKSSWVRQGLSAARKGLPLYKIVESLNELARQ